MSTTDTSVSTASSPADLQQKTIIAAVNATALYVLAYLTADTVYRLVTVLVASQAGIRGTWQLDRIKFLIADSEWSRNEVLAVYGLGPLACLALGAVAALWFWRGARFKRGLFKQYLMWLVLHGINLFFGAMVADTLTQSGFWYVPSWLFLAGNGINVAVAFLFGLIMAVLGYFAAIIFLQSHDSRTLMRYRNRRRLLLATLFLPWMAGSLLLTLAKYPDPFINEQLHLASLFLLLGPLAFASLNELFEFTIDAPQKTRIAWSLVVMLGVLLAGSRLLIGHGVSFG